MSLPDPAFWRGRRVLVTGATGFKGAWLSLWLTRMGAVVTGYAHAPRDDGIYAASGIAPRLTPVLADIRHDAVLRQCMHLMRPEVVFHLAGAGTNAPAAELYEVNTLGTVKLLEEARRARSVRAAVIVTSDAVYDAAGGVFDENGHLGGRGPYGASKAAMELAVAAFRAHIGADHRLKIATARTSCAIGGGDWTADRLTPDAMRAFTAGNPFQVRTPDAEGQWLYVLDALAGYLTLAERLHDDPDAGTAWNFGGSEPTTVSALADMLVDAWNADDWREPRAAWEPTYNGAPAPAIILDSSRAGRILDWAPRYTLDRAAAAAVAWHAAQAHGEHMADVSGHMLDDYLES
ncbi:MAG: NAD-dependent epimerase/dehydratase family protein [Rhodospirillaceae bacterium]|nr:NAD-dependent epimerase/dehydratase family protein [Rhodospirillaceae bacterium]